MNAYAPTDAGVVLAVLGVLLATLALGYAVAHRRARALAWALVVAAVVGAGRLTATEPAGFRMLAIIGALLFAMKAVVAVESGSPLGLANWIRFAALWFGMRPRAFASVPGPARDGAGALVRRGLARLATGAVFVGIAAGVASSSLPEPWRRIVATVALLPGLSLALHFGVFNLVAGFWRSRGAECRPLFRAPLASRSLAEFWGRRWNLAFSEMTSLAVHRPLRRRVGPRAATAVAFLFSGLLHELAISVPARGGYGGPLLYFALHAIAMAIEARGVVPARWGRAWTLAWLVLPAPLLFHVPFLRGCVWPLVGLG